jgi:hypothetical protein
MKPSTTTAIPSNIAVGPPSGIDAAPTARKEMEALRMLQVVDKAEGMGESETHIWLAEMFDWFKSDECRELIGW